MTTLIFIGLCILLAIVMIVGYYFATKLQDIVIKRCKEYEQKYKIIKFRIDYDPQTAENYSSIDRMLTCLGKLPYKNKEKTIVLKQHFWITWSHQRSCRLNTHLDEILKEQMS